MSLRNLENYLNIDIGTPVNCNCYTTVRFLFSFRAFILVLYICFFPEKGKLQNLIFFYWIPPRLTSRLQTLAKSFWARNSIIFTSYFKSRHMIRLTTLMFNGLFTELDHLAIIWREQVLLAANKLVSMSSSRISCRRVFNEIEICFGRPVILIRQCKITWKFAYFMCAFITLLCKFLFSFITIEAWLLVVEFISNIVWK